MKNRYSNKRFSVRPPARAIQKISTFLIDSPSVKLTAWIGGWSAVGRAAVSRLAARLAAKADGAVTMPATVTDAGAVAVLRTWGAHSQLTDLFQLHALLVDAHARSATLSAIGSQSRIDGLQAKIHQRCAASDNLAIV